ncbi:hypothetical protein D9M73_246890 [compost metagenome]
MVAGQAEADRRLVALLRQHPAHAQVGAHPLDGLVAGEVFQGEVGFQGPFVMGSPVPMVPQQGHAAQALDFVHQVVFQFGS